MWRTPPGHKPKYAMKFILENQPAEVAARADRLHEFTFSILCRLTSRVCSALYVGYVCYAYVREHPVWSYAGSLLGHLLGPRKGRMLYEDLLTTLEYHYRQARNQGAIGLAVCRENTRQKLVTRIGQQIINASLPSLPKPEPAAHSTASWIIGYKVMPTVRGELWASDLWKVAL